MNLCFDVGNSKTRAAVFFNSRALEDLTLIHEGNSSERWGRYLKRWAANYGIESIGMVSVDPGLARPMKMTIKRVLGLAPVIISAGNFIGMSIRYRHPEKLGADRLINAYAAYRIYGGPVMVVDVGTAITWDAVGARGEFLGGAIAPGPGTMAKALNDNTAALPLVKLKKRPRPLGRDTRECIESGLYWGTVGMIKELSDRISHSMRSTPKMIFTGGMGPMFAREFPDTLVDELLTLRGIDLVLKNIKSEK